MNEGIFGSKFIDPWHYVGDPGEPPFLNGWVNLGFGQSKLAYRRTVIGGLQAVVMQGAIGGGAATQATVAMLPEEYIPERSIGQIFGLRTPDFVTLTTQGVGTFGYGSGVTPGTLGLTTPQTVPILGIVFTGFYFLDAPEVQP